MYKGFYCKGRFYRFIYLPLVNFYDDRLKDLWQFQNLISISASKKL